MHTTHAYKRSAAPPTAGTARHGREWAGNVFYCFYYQGTGGAGTGTPVLFGKRQLKRMKQPLLALSAMEAEWRRRLVVSEEE
jgi:hypothetical protein